MILTKATSETNQYIIVEDNNSKFIIGWFGADVYWIMLDYIPDNKFIVTKSSPKLWEFLSTLFKENHFKNCTFIWNSEAGINRIDNRLKITKGQNYFKIRFFQGEKDSLSKLQNTCPICFCLSGSRNPKIAESFSIFLHKLLNSD